MSNIEIDKDIEDAIKRRFEYKQRNELQERIDAGEENIDDLELKEILDFLDSSSSFENRKIGSTDILLKNVAYIYENLVNGVPKKRIAESLGVSNQMFYKLSKTNKYFANLIERAKVEQVENVRQSLVSKATDKYVKGQKVTPTGKVIDYEKYVPADFQAIKFYLLNNDSENYKEKQEIEITKKEFIIDIIDVDEDGNPI